MNSHSSQASQVSPQNYSYVRFAQDGDLDEFILHEIIESTLQQVNEIIDQNYIATLDIPLATEMAMKKLFSIVNLAMFPHDGTVTRAETNSLPLPLEYFQPDPEPLQCPIDNWARGAIPTRHIQPLEDPLFNLESKSDGTRTPSVSSMRSSRTGSSKTSSLSSRAISRNGTHRLDHLHDNSSPKIIELDESNSLSTEGHGGAAAGLNSTNHLYDMLQKQNNRLKKFTQVDDETRDEFDLLQEQLSRTSTELRGKRFAVDSTGKAIGIAPMKSDALPPYSLFPSHNIAPTPAPSSSSAGPSAGTGTGAGGGKKGSRKRVSNDQSSSSALSPSYPHFLPTPSLATSLSAAHSSIPLAPGVSLKSKVIFLDSATANPSPAAAASATGATGTGAGAGGGVSSVASPCVREGPHLPSDPKKLSRAEYFAKQQTISRMTSLASSTGAPGTGAGYGAGAGYGGASSFGELSEYSSSSNPPLSAAASPAAAPGAPGGGAGPSRSSSRGGGGVAGGGGGVKTSRYLDLNPLEGGRVIDPEEQLRQAAKGLKSREEREREERGDGRTKEDSRSRSRILGIGAAGAGAGGGVPQKPTMKQKEIVGQLHGSQSLAGPRDRLASHTLESRRKLPTPGAAAAAGGAGAGAGMSQSLLSAAGSVSTAGRGGGRGGGSVKRERADLAKEIFR